MKTKSEILDKRAYLLEKCQEIRGILQFEMKSFERYRLKDNLNDFEERISELNWVLGIKDRECFLNSKDRVFHP